jgi:Co/Zn/Cd efflux system component
MALSIAVALLTIGMKTAAWLITGSVGLLSDAMEAFVNLAAAMFGLIMLTVAARPADAEHPLGVSLSCLISCRIPPLAPHLVSVWVAAFPGFACKWLRLR